MVHITVGIAQFFIILLTQMMIVAVELLAVALAGCGCVFLMYRYVRAHRRR